MKTLETAIIGAGPYGLSIAAQINGLDRDYRIYGKPMDTWKNHNPKGMLLKSDGFASNLSTPRSEYDLRSYCADNLIRYDDFAMPPKNCQALALRTKDSRLASVSIA